METRVAGGNNRPVQEAKVREDGWTQARRKCFLDTLAATCNVRMATEAVNIGPANAYALRRRDPAFAALWKEALTIGYERLEEKLLEIALEGVNAIEIDTSIDVVLPAPRGKADKGAAFQPGSGGIAGMQTGPLQLAMMLLNRHRATVEGRSTPVGGRKHVSAEETDAALRKKLDALARQLKAAK